MGASAILKSVDFRAFEINVKTIAPTQKLYQFGHAIWCRRPAAQLMGSLLPVPVKLGGAVNGNTILKIK
ncbi:hypothetical protein D5281_24785 [bacterium 1xD42-62]|uniref:Uncharacterized protein n=1 Tax=Parablautia muri TaxID=2320879 RepID=A0A9X5BKJ8_9FIRM|nr:hypothetical protein [Parablautia muri]